MSVQQPTAPRRPAGALAVRVVAMPANTNQNGDIFGGWIMSQMDIAGGVYSKLALNARVVTVAVEALTFHKPVKVGDEVSCYTQIVRQGKTSIAIHVQVWVRRLSDVWNDDEPQGEHAFVMVTEGDFIYVAIDQHGRPFPYKHIDLENQPEI